MPILVEVMVLDLQEQQPSRQQDFLHILNIFLKKKFFDLEQLLRIRIKGKEF